MKSYAAANGLLNLAYRTVDFEGIAVNDPTGAAVNIDIALHIGVVARGDPQTAN